jgi:hypothetical protein
VSRSTPHSVCAAVNGETVRRTGLTVGDRAREDLDEKECLRLLGSAEVGRLGYTQAALPAIQPVTYSLEDGALVMPADPGSPSVAAICGAIVVLAVDSFGAGECDVWAVTVVGPTHLVGGHLVLELGLVTGWRRAVPHVGTPTA